MAEESADRAGTDTGTGADTAPDGLDDDTTSGADTAPPSEPADTGEKDWQAEAEKWKALSRQHEARAGKDAKELARLKAEEQEREDAAKTELERTSEALSRERAERLGLQRRTVAAEAGLPAELAERLQGETEEELVADAARLAELMPAEKPSSPPAKAAGIGVTGGEPTETDPIKLARQWSGRR